MTTFLFLSKLSLLSLCGLMTATWIISLIRKDASIIDQFWGISFILQAYIYSFHTNFQNDRLLLLLILITIWGLRLSIHLHFRNKGKEEDYRYQAFRKQYGPKQFWWKSLIIIFYLQGGLSFIIASPILFIASQNQATTWTLFDILGSCLFIFGFLVESISDWQLMKFKSNKKNKGLVLTSGLWSFSRHPNYFGDSLVWWGVFFIALSLPYGILSIVGPITMTYLLVKVSGADLLEKKLKTSKPHYNKQTKHIPKFFPRFK